MQFMILYSKTRTLTIVPAPYELGSTIWYLASCIIEWTTVHYCTVLKCTTNTHASHNTATLSIS